MICELAVSERIPSYLSEENEFVANASMVNLFESSRLKGRERRTQNLSTKLTASEETELQKASVAEGKTLSEWARDVLLRVARHKPSGSSQESVVLTEIVGVQLLLMNVLSPLTRGEQLSPEQYQAIIKSVQASKGRTTQELLSRRGNAEEP